MKIKNRPFSPGFTLIELLVVITIIAVLATIAVPAYTAVQLKAALAKASSNARGIGIACVAYASDYGTFPMMTDSSTGKPDPSQTPSTSNDCLTSLYPDYVPDKNTFWLGADKGYCNPVTSVNATPTLQAGENHWAYIPNLSTNSPSLWPMIVDPTTGNGQTTYSTDSNAKGGTWQGKKAIVVHVDTSTTIEQLNKTTKTISGPNSDIPDLLATGKSNWLGTTNSILNPLSK